MRTKRTVGTGRGRRGQAVVLMTMCIVVTLGMLGLVVDLGLAHWRKLACTGAAQSAAMAAAKSAGTNFVTQSLTACSDITSGPLYAGCQYAARNGFTHGGNNGSIAVNMAAGISGAPVANIQPAYWVSATVSETIPQWFTSIFGRRSTRVTSRATAAVFSPSGGGCIYVLEPNQTGITASGTPDLISGCGVYVNSASGSAVRLTGNARIETTGGAMTHITGNWTASGNGTITPAPRLGVTPAQDSFRNLPLPSYSGCDASGAHFTGSDQRTFTADGSTPYVICGGITLSGKSSVTFQPGLYVIKGGLKMSGQTTLEGDGVTLFVQDGAVDMSGGSAVTLSGPGQGPWQNITIFQPQTNSNGLDLSGGAAQSINGVIYAPAAHIDYTGGSSSNFLTTTIVCNTLRMTGNSYIQAAATTALTSGPAGAFLVE